jgi:polygalacturonase/sugar lactone lactonase YvrE
VLSQLRLALTSLLTLCVICPLGAIAQQAPIALPNTVTTVGGGVTSALTVGAACSTGSSLTATDTLGDGCPATSAYFGTTSSGDLRGGVATDPAGNIYVMDSGDSALRRINAHSNIITLLAGLGTACSSKSDDNGDNCPLANTKFSSTPRGMGSDPYGNIFVAGYGSDLVNLVCNAVSPLCPNTTGTHQIGSMYLVAGCVVNTGNAGTAGPGAATGATGGIATPTGTCNSTVTELDQPRGVTADRYGNVYIADTGDLRYLVVVGPASYNGVANPLAALIALNPAYSGITAATAVGNIYPLLGGFTPPASGMPCVTGSSTNSLDAFGDGCPYYVSSLNNPSSSAVQGIAVDPNGNILISDVSAQRLRVIYMGGAQMASAITANNPMVTSPVAGSIYSIAGGGSSSSSSTPQLGSEVSIDTSAFKVTTDFQGNIYIGDNTSVLFFDINTGYIRKLAPSGPTFGGSNGLGVAVNELGDLILADSTNLLIRNVAATSLASTAVNSSSTQNILLHGAAGTTYLAASQANLSVSEPISIGVSSCGSENADKTLDCTVPVTFSPVSPGRHTVTLAAVPSGASETGLLPLIGTATGTALVFDGFGNNAALIGTSLQPTGLATDGNGNFFTYDLATASMTEVTGLVPPTHLTGTLPGTPTQIAIDASGNIYAVGGGAITEFALGSNGSYTAAGSIAFAPNGATATPQAIAIDAAGNLFVYDSTSKSIYRQSKSKTGALTSLIASGFDHVVALALDSLGNLYVSDSGVQSIYTITPSGVQTTLATGVSARGIGADSAGDLYAADTLTGSVFEYPVSGPRTTLSTSLTQPAGVAVDPFGNVYVADTTQSGLVEIPRNITRGSFGTSLTTTLAGTITNAGNIAASGLAQTDSADIALAPGLTAGCNLSTVSKTFASGEACTVQATFTPQTSTSGAAVSNIATFLPAATTIGSAEFTGTVPTNLTTTSITGETPDNPRFAASGTEVMFTVTVLNAPSGSAVAVSVDSGAATSYMLNASGMTMVSLSNLALGTHTLSAAYAGATNAQPSSASVAFTINQFVATGDTRTVAEPSFPAVCNTLTAALTSVNDDLPVSVDATVTNPDGARIQAAINSCANTGKAVELSVDAAGHNAYLTGPLSMPSGVTLLVDPGVYVYFSRNVQDYDAKPGTHTCGTVNSASATSSCLPLIDIPASSTNVGIMGFGKLDGRGGDTLINAFPSTYAGQSWWGLSSIANSGGSQQNPRFIQMETGSSNITLYKITLRNSPLFHVSTTGAVSGFTAWDIKIVTPTSSRNTDGIDPGNAQNFTITRSWISDGDDNVAVGAAKTAPVANISVTNNHFFAGHGQSIGSFTQGGVSNVLFDSNMSSGNGIAGSGSSIENTADTNSTGIRIKSGYDRGGVVRNIQYSNSCFQDHNAEIDFNPNYENTTGSLSPNFENILMQNLTFLTTGTAQFTGTNNSGSILPLQLTLDNVSFPGTYPASEFNPAPTNAALTYGPGQVSSDFMTDYATFAGSNGNTVTNKITASNLLPPTCNFTYIAPELTGPSGLPQTITEGQNATAVVILTPAVGGAAYPTGNVTLTDALTGSATIVTLPGTTDTLFVPLTSLAVGTHTFTATYSGDTNYPLTPGQTAYSTTAPYEITVNAGSLGSTTTMLSGVPSSTSFGTSFMATATVAGSGSTPIGNVQFIVNGSVNSVAAVSSSGTATATISLPFSTVPYSIYAIYSGDAVNDGSTSPTSSVTVTAALTTTTLSASATTATLGHPIALTATVTSPVGTPTGAVMFTYTTTGNGSPVQTTAAVIGGVATAGVSLPTGTDSITATYVASGSFAGSASLPVPVTVSAGTIFALPGNPIPLPYTMTTLAGGAAANCSTATDSFGDGCQATSMLFSGSVDLRSVVADPFGNVYLTDAVSNLVRKIAPNGIISDFAGRVTGTACVPTATTGCTPSLVSLDKPRGISSDSQGNIYIAGYESQLVFKVSASTGLMYVVAGTGSTGNAGDGGPASSAKVNSPRGVWGDTVGNVYIADTSNNKIRVVDITGNIQTFAGTGTAASNGDGAPATSAAIDNPQGVLTDANLNVYIADSAKVRVVCVTCGTGSPLDALLATLGTPSAQNGYIYTIAGGAAAAYSGTYPTLATNVTMAPQKLAIDGSSNLYISDGNGAVWFLDSHTGEIRPIAGKQTANCSTATDSFGDGCPATQAVIGDGGNGIGVGIDTQGNLYISDTLNARIRKVTTGLASGSTATGSLLTQPVQLHFINGDTFASIATPPYTAPEWSLGTPACTSNADNTADCLLASTFTPAVPGSRSMPVTINSSLGNSANLALTGTGLGAGSTLDPANQVSFGANLKVAGLAVDTAGNVYVSDTNSKQLLRFAPTALTQGTIAPSTSLVTLTSPGAVAVDPRGYVYVADTSKATITQISPAGATSTLALPLKAPSGLAVDALNNLYVSDSSAQTVYQLNPITGVSHALAVGTLVAPAGLTIDPNGNLLISDPGAAAIYRFNLQSGVTTTVSSPAAKPFAIATDAAGNLLIADTASIFAVPASTNSTPFTVASLSPLALAIDSAGNLYTSSGGSVLALTRTQGSVQFAGASASPQTVDLLGSGNQPLQLGSVSQTDTTDYSLTAASSTDCTLNGTSPSTLAVGGVCSLTATYTPTSLAKTTDIATFNGNLANAALSTPPSVQLTLTGTSMPVATATTTSLTSSANPSMNGQSVTFTATVAGVGNNTPLPTGSVTFLNGSTTLGTGTLNGSAQATLSVSTLEVGAAPITAQYAGDMNYAGSTSSVLTQTVSAPASYTVTFNPTSLTVSSGQSGTVALTVTPVGGFNQPVTFSCAGLPQFSTCTFNPATVTPTGGAAASTMLTIATNVNVASNDNKNDGRTGTRGIWYAGLIMGLGFLITLRKKRDLTAMSRRLALLIFMLLTATAALQLTGCGSSGGSSPSSTMTPTGTSTITVTTTSGSQVQTGSFTLIVQ